MFALKKQLIIMMMEERPAISIILLRIGINNIIIIMVGNK